MAWYKTGRVAVTLNSATVTGTGTDFVSNVRVGDAFIGPNGSQYEVTNIASATVLSISPVYGGATASNAVYGIMPINGYPKLLVDKVGQIIEQWGASLANMGPVASQSVVPVSMGGTGATTAANARNALELKTAALVDVVGTSAAGAIIETGTNANGRYTKYADGTLICTSTVVSLAIDVAASATVTSPTYSFPASFIEEPAKTYSGYVTDTVGSTLALGIHEALGGVAGWKFAVRNTGNIAVTRIARFSATAIGRWK